MNARAPLLLLSIALLATGCDDKVIEDSGDTPIEEPVDADGDGYEEGEDCDDADAAVNPGAAEICDGLDNDCDGEIDNQASDALTFYSDSDGDGFGDGESPVLACALSEGLVEDATDCNDLDGAVSPGAQELGCDGVDNDCDGGIDLNTVPTEYASLQEAVDDLEDGSEICVEPGTYAEQLDLSGRSLRFTGQQGAEQTELEVGGAGPLITLVGESASFGSGELTLSGFSVVGEVNADGVERLGGFAYLEGGTLRLEDVRVSGLALEMANGGFIEGGLIYAIDSKLQLQDVDMEGVSMSLSGESVGSEQLTGGLLRTVRGELEMNAVQVTGLSLSGDVAREVCIASGIILAADDNGSMNKYDPDAVGTQLAIDGLALRESTLSLRCGSSSGLGAMLRLLDVEGEVGGFVVQDNDLEAFSSGYSNAGYLVSSRSQDDRGLVYSGLEIVDNRISAGGDGYGGISTLVDGRFTDVVGARIWGNTLTASHLDGGGLGGLVRADDSSVSYIDLRGNTLQATGYASALVEQFSEVGASLEYFIVAGNRVSAGELYAAAVEVGGEGVDVDVRYGDVVGNSFEGSIPYDNGVLRAGGEEVGDVVSVSGVQLIDNTYQGDDALPTILTWLEDSVTVAYCNLFGNSGEETSWEPITGSDGNLAASPLYVDVAGSDPTLWDLHLQAGSPAVDSGAPEQTDVDGSRADMGAYGGAGGADW